MVGRMRSLGSSFRSFSHSTSRVVSFVALLAMALFLAPHLLYGQSASSTTIDGWSHAQFGFFLSKFFALYLASGIVRRIVGNGFIPSPSFTVRAVGQLDDHRRCGHRRIRRSDR